MLYSYIILLTFYIFSSRDVSHVFCMPYIFHEFNINYYLDTNYSQVSTN
jgi:hypothetical protein